ncbi:MAG: glycosyltransferase family 4 protein [Patescibacteria group bacterium]
MKIACNTEVFSDLDFAKNIYEITPIDISSFYLFKNIKNFGLVLTNWPSKKNLFWLHITLFLFPSKKLAIFTYPQEINYKLSILDKKLLLRANRIICPNLESARHGGLSMIYWKSPEKFREIPYGVDLNKYLPRESLRPSTNEIVTKFKEIINFVTKKVIKKGLPNILISCNNTEDWFEILTNERIDGRIKYFDNQEEDSIRILKNYQESDIFVVPKIEGENTIKQIIEALSCGLAIIAPRVAKVTSIFDHDKHGLFFKPHDNEDLLEKINCLCNNEEKREMMSSAARKLAENRYSKNQRENKILQIIKELDS